MNKITNRTPKKQIMAMELDWGDCLRECSKELKDDKDVVMKFVKKWGKDIQHASDRLRDDEDVVKTAVSNGHGLTPFEYASDRIRSEKKIIKFAVKYKTSSFLYACDELRKNKEFILELVKLYGPKPIHICYYQTRDKIYERLKNPAIQVLEAMIEEDTENENS